MNRRIATAFMVGLLAFAQTGLAVDQIDDDRKPARGAASEADEPPYMRVEAAGRIRSIERTPDGFDVTVTSDAGVDETYSVPPDTPVDGAASAGDLHNGDDIRLILTQGRVTAVVLKE